MEEQKTEIRRHDRYMDNNHLLFDNCCGTMVKMEGEMRLKCIGGGFMGWFDLYADETDRPTGAVQPCTCRSLPVAQYRQAWVGRYLGGIRGQIDEKVLRKYMMEDHSFYWQSKDPNPTIVKLAGLIGKDYHCLTVTQLNETLAKVGKPYNQKSFYEVFGKSNPLEKEPDERTYYLPIGGYWIILDADAPEPTELVSEHYNKLINGANYKNYGLMISSKLEWNEFKVKYSIGKQFICA